MTYDLIIDPQIRLWVFLPIFIITYLFGIIRHFFLIMMKNQRNVDKQYLQDIHAIIRSKKLQTNYKYIPRNGFYFRKTFFNNKDFGYFTKNKPNKQQNLLTDPNFVFEFLKGNMANVLPMIVLGGWINWVFSGIIATKAPFPLTQSFKSMLQKDIELRYLHPSWISSVSLYFLNVFGFRNICNLALEENSCTEGQDDTWVDQVSELSSGMPMDNRVVFKSEWETLELIQYHWKLTSIELILFANFNY